MASGAGGSLAREDDRETDLRTGGRVDFGIDCRLGGNIVLGLDSFRSGLGRNEPEQYSADIDLRINFQRILRPWGSHQMACPPHEGITTSHKEIGQ